MKAARRAEDWQQQVDRNYEYAKRMLLETGSVEQMFIIHGAERSVPLVVGVSMEPATGILLAKFLRVLAVAEAAEGASSITEAWARSVLTMPGETVAEAMARANAGPRPSQAEDRREIIIVTTTWRDDVDEMHTLHRSGEIERNAKADPVAVVEQTPGPGEETSIKGRHMDIVPPSPPPDDVREVARHMLPELAKGLGIDWLPVHQGGRA